MRPWIEELWLKAVRLYTYHTPVAKGKYRLFQAALRVCKYDHKSLPATARDGRRFTADLSTGMHDQLFFLGEYEKAISLVTSRLISRGDTCIDVGANFGWYTTLMSCLCGPEGKVHAFEPVPTTYNELQANVSLLASGKNIKLNPFALGDEKRDIAIHIPENEPTGHASIARKADGHSESFNCRMIALNDYLEENSIGDVNFVKVDVEGAELMFLKGANRLFDQNVPPIFLMEMALEQSKHFGYLPNDLVNFISERGEYSFYSVNERSGRITMIDGFEKDDIGANVFCIPAAMSIDPIRDLISI